MKGLATAIGLILAMPALAQDRQTTTCAQCRNVTDDDKAAETWVALSCSEDNPTPCLITSINGRWTRQYLNTVGLSAAPLPGAPSSPNGYLVADQGSAAMMPITPLPLSPQNGVTVAISFYSDPATATDRINGLMSFSGVTTGSIVALGRKGNQLYYAKWADPKPYWLPLWDPVIKPGLGQADLMTVFLTFKADGKLAIDGYTGSGQSTQAPLASRASLLEAGWPITRYPEAAGQTKQFLPAVLMWLGASVDGQSNPIATGFRRMIVFDRVLERWERTASAQDDFGQGKYSVETALSCNTGYYLNNDLVTTDAVATLCGRRSSPMAKPLPDGARLPIGKFGDVAAWDSGNGIANYVTLSAAPLNRQFTFQALGGNYYRIVTDGDQIVYNDVGAGLVGLTDVSPADGSTAWLLTPVTAVQSVGNAIIEQLQVKSALDGRTIALPVDSTNRLTVRSYDQAATWGTVFAPPRVDRAHRAARKAIGMGSRDEGN